MRLCFCLLLALLPSLAVAWDWHPELTQIDQRLRAIAVQQQALPPLPAPQLLARAGFHSAFVATTQAARWVQVDLGDSREFDSVMVVPAFSTPSEDGSGAYGMPSRFRIDASDDADFASYQTLLDHTENDFQGGISPVVASVTTRARYIRFTATRLAQQRLGRGFFSLGEVLVFAGPLDIAIGCPVTSSAAYENPPTWALANLTDGLCALGAPIVPSSLRSNGWHSAMASSPDQTKWLQLDLGSVQPLDELRLYPAHPPDFPERPGFGFPVRFRIEVSDDAGFTRSQRLLDATAGDYINPADNAVIVPAHQLPVRFVRLTATKLWERTDDFVIALSEMEAYSQGKNAALGAGVTSSDETKTPLWSAPLLVDGHTSLGSITAWPDWLRNLALQQSLTTELAALRQQRAEFVARQQRGWLWAGGGAALAAVVLITGLYARQRVQQRRSLLALRRQIARDLHDEIGSSLGSIALMSELALRDNDPAALQEIHRLSREASESMRGIVWLVRESETPTLERLVETLRQTAASLLTGMQWQLTAPTVPAPRVASLDFHRHVFLFCKEAMHNIARHARAGSVRMEVGWSPQQLTICIADDGIGFDPEQASTGSGLANLRHRAEVLRARLSLISQPGQGTRIILEAPLS